MKIPFLPALLVAFVFAGCGPGKFSAKPPEKGAKTFTYALETGITTLDPGKVQEIYMSDVLINVFEGLVGYNEKNEIEPRVAEKWTYEDGGKTLVFDIRPNVKFHNGRALVADDFKWAMERNLGPKLASPVATTYLGDIVGVKEFVAGKAKTVTGIEVRGPLTLAIRIDKPKPYFIGNLTYPCAFALPREVVKETEIKTKEEAIGTGPFKFDRIAPDQEIDLVANKDYFLGAPKIDRIVRPIIKDAAARLTQYKNGSLDYLLLYRRDATAIQSDPVLSKQLTYDPRANIAYFATVSQNYAPFKDIRVRRAFAISFDRARLVKEVLAGYDEAKSLIPVGIPGHDDSYPGLTGTADEAKRLLAEAGYPGGQGLPPLQLSYTEANPDDRVCCEAAVTAWKQNLGVTVQLQGYEFGTLLAKRNKRELAFISLGWTADYIDPQDFMSLLMSSTSPENKEGYRNDAFDRLCALADVEQDPAKRIKLYQEANDVAIKDVGRIPSYSKPDPILVRPRVHGLRSCALGLLPHRLVSVD